MRMLILATLLVTQLATTAHAGTMYIPVAGVTPGNNATFWRTDVRIFNPSAVRGVDVTLYFLPRGHDGRDVAGRTFHVGRRETLVLDNVVATLAPEQTHAVGAIRIDSGSGATADFIASSRTYTTSPDATRPGTFGQFVPAFGPGQATRSAALLHVASRPDVRTNLGVMNPGLDPVTVRFTLFGTDGPASLESPPLLVPPRSMQQWSMTDAFVFGGVYIANATIVVETTAPAFTWASVVDNVSGDAIFVHGVPPEPTAAPLP